MRLYEMVAKRESFDNIARVSRLSKNIDEKADNGWTALMFAIDNNDANVVDTLIENGADVNFETPDGLTPLRFARMNGNEKIISLLLKAGA